MNVNASHACIASRDQKSAGFPETGVTDNCELPCECWELKLDSQEQQLVL